MPRRLPAILTPTSLLAAALALSAPALAQDAAPKAPPAQDFGSWGVDLDALDQQVDPGDDFNAYVNGKWLATNDIPADRSSYGPFEILTEKSVSDVEVLVRKLVAADPAPGTTARRIVDAYQAFYNMPAIDASGLAPAYPYLTEIFAAPDLARLAQLFETPGYPALINAGVTVDDRHPNFHEVTIGFDGMGLPDRDYYLVDSERNLAVRSAYQDYLAFLLEQAGYVDPASAAKAVYAFEEEVARLEWARSLMRNANLTYNTLTPEELRALAPDFPIDALLAAGGFEGRSVYLAAQLPPTPEEIATLGLTEAQLADIGGGLPAMMQLLTQTPLATLKAFMAAQFLSSNAPFLTSDLDAASFAFFGGVIQGSEEQRPRWKRAIDVVQGQLGEQLAALYVARYFPPAAKTQMEALVGNLRRSMAASLDDNTWMTAPTVEQARAKLATMSLQVGYPAEFETYDGLEIEADDPLGNRMRAAAWRQADSLAELDEPVDRNEWFMLPQRVNAYYAPNFNQIVFPAAILQPPMFDPDADPSVNYGAIGAVIGHEIGHGFDDQGSQYDENGALRDWWQAQDRAGFDALADKMGTLIEAYCPIDDGGDGMLCLKADQSMGETLGDVVGLQMAYRAYRMSLNGEEDAVVDGLTGDQRFFLGFGQVWRSKQRDDALRNRVLTANHPPSEFRLNNTVRHVDAWYDAFDVGPDNALYLPPEERVRIW